MDSLNSDAVSVIAGAPICLSSIACGYFTFFGSAFPVRF
jgi:hypothetical protein